MEKKKKTRIVTPKDICLPFVNVKQQTYYRVVSSSRAKRQRKAFWYNDYYLDMLPDIEETVNMMNKRERFKDLREFVDKIKNMSMYDDFRMRFLISAQSDNDCNLAMLYINYHLEKAKYSFISYNRTYRLHKDWKIANPRLGIYDKPEDKVNDKNPGEAKMAAKPEESTSGPHEATEPEWTDDLYPMYVDTDWPDCATILADKNLLDKYSLIYAVENRNSSPPQTGGFFDVFMGVDDSSLMAGCEPPPDKSKSLIQAGFKTIFIPDCGDDELRVLFGKVVANMGMTLARDLSFENVRREYGDYFITEHDLLSAARIIKEHKLLFGKLKAPIIYRDFVSVFEADKEARVRCSSSARKNKAENPWDELNKLIGVDQIKTEARKMVDSMLLEKRRKELGLPGGQNTKHSLFFGDPGTSKTTVARILAKILQYEGLIKSNAFRDLNKSDVVGAYVGHTAMQVDGIFKEIAGAGGGVLFFDEAYTYTAKDSATSFDKEAINCIVQNMENYREIMCIFAGYKKQMQEFVEANPGLRSRIGFVFEFSEYDAPSMCKIVNYQAKQLGYKMPEGCEKMLEDYFAQLRRLQGEGWGNGREARKLVENAVLELAARLAKQKRMPSKAQVSALEMRDIENAIRNSMDRERAFEKNGAKKIGFV